MHNSLDVSAPGHSPWILDWTCFLSTPYVMFTFPTRIFYRAVPGFATDCLCGVWCRGLTTCPLYVGPLFGNLVITDSRFVSLTYRKTLFWLFLIVSHLNSLKYNTLFSFTLPLMVLYFPHSTSVLSFHTDCVLTLSIRKKDEPSFEQKQVTRNII